MKILIILGIAFLVSLVGAGIYTLIFSMFARRSGVVQIEFKTKNDIEREIFEQMLPKFNRVKRHVVTEHKQNTWRSKLERMFKEASK